MRPARTALLLLIALAAAAARGDTTVPSRPIAPVPPGALPRDTSSSARALLLAMGAAVAEVRDYTMTLVKQEWDDKALGSEETLVSKWARPCSVYFKRLSPPHLGREILYVNGWNSDQPSVQSVVPKAPR